MMSPIPVLLFVLFHKVINHFASFFVQCTSDYVMDKYKLQTAFSNQGNGMTAKKQQVQFRNFPQLQSQNLL